MRDPLRSPFSNKSDFATDTSGESWLYRVRDNLAQLLLPSHLKASSANGAPIHLLKFDKSLRPARAQGASLLTHATIFAAVLYIFARPPVGPPPIPPDGTTPLSGHTPSSDFLRNLFAATPSDGRGHGSNNDSLPAKRGELPPFSRLVLVKPSLPQNRVEQLPVPPTLFDPNAAPILTPTRDPGLPWMPDNTISSGKDKGTGMGSIHGDDVGDGADGPAGRGSDNLRYGPGFIAPLCSYCPYPTYTDDARKAKVQGAVTLQVLVGADGRAQDIRIVKGIGFGLDERALETVRGWKFIAAHDGSKRAVPASVTVEAYFRLF